jgi:hypothetical protein
MSALWWDSDSKDRSTAENHVHVGNLPWGTDDLSLKDTFSNYDPHSCHLKMILPKVISPTQSAFFPRRMITGNVIVSYESIHTIKVRGKVSDKGMTTKAYWISTPEVCSGKGS